ncbi:3-oxo-5-alpha-steroid 4-dehydrogenase 1-like [Branchiostoma lanceolatum]|uniref:3-oxo-5-alpha-steroid 4-dehydrogenase 1-like n=1 Tax=Branchiostoma lanceolatum TaxID=7740 RepID=UPI0034563D74
MSEMLERVTDYLYNMLPSNEEALVHTLAYVMLGLSVPVFFITTFVKVAEYGRYAVKSSWELPARVAWLFQELPSFAVPVILVLSGRAARMTQLPNQVLMAMFVAHYFQRTFIFSLLIRGGKKTPFHIFRDAFMFCTYNGYMQGRYLAEFAHYPDTWLADTRCIVGIGMFLVGMGINLHADHVLRNLRKPGETGYKIPQGGMFTYVSGANFFGEIVEWTGFAIACWSLPAAAFAVFTASNIGPRAYRHHKWYLQKFDNYPKSRKAVIPFLI